MDPKPYIGLLTPRTIHRSDLPPDLAEFYCHNEGVGLESPPERMVRLCLLEEVKLIQWHDLHVIGADPAPGWEKFSAWRIGISSFFDEIVYVINAPSCASNAIMTLGIDVAGPGGDGPFANESTLVLGSSLSTWLEHLKTVNWMEYGLAPGAINEVPSEEQIRLRKYYRTLNPQATWLT